MPRNIITYGTFDLFHIGHLKLLQRTKSMGDYLIVAVSTDDFTLKKGKKTIIPFKQRAEIVENIKCVDLVIPEDSWEQKISDIKKYNIDTFVMGNDWEGKFDDLEKFCNVIYIDRTENISSTEIKRALKTFSVSRNEILQAFDVLEQIKKDFE